MRKRLKSIGVLLALVGSGAAAHMVTASHSALAQEGEAGVPPDLVRAILARSGERAIILPGVVAEPVSAVVRFPTGWRVLGSVLYGASASVYVRAGGTPEAVRQSLEEQLLGSGWTTPEQTQRRGFVPEESPPSAICGPDGQLITLWISKQTDGVLVRLGLQDRADPSPCARRADPASMYQEINDRMPILSFPEGQVRLGGMGGDGRNTAFSGIELETTRDLDEITAHVSADLLASGWELDATATGDVSVVRTWTREFEGGFRAFGQLLIVTIGAGKYDVTFQITKTSGR